MKILSWTEVLSNPIFRVIDARAVAPDGFEIHRHVVAHDGSAVMLAVDDRQRILLVRQYRLPAGDYLWELPAGRIDPGEKPLAAAKRELLEETGYRARHWEKLISFYPTPGYVAERMTVFLATGLSLGPAKPQEDERIRCRWFTAEELDRAIRTGRIVDGKTILAFLYWRYYRCAGDKPGGTNRTSVGSSSRRRRSYEHPVPARAELRESIKNRISFSNARPR